MLNKFFSGKEGNSSDDSGFTDRQPCVAGQFYPGNAGELNAELKKMFALALPRKQGKILALVSPHAGYVFSGQVAATAYNQIEPGAKYDRIFLIGSSHRTWFDGASVYNQGDYVTPLGKVRVDLELANQFIKTSDVFEFRPEAHTKEHGLEVQLPFLQYHLESDFRIVPIIIATQSIATIQKISETLKPFFNPGNLFVISSDFSHYPAYEQAMEVDRMTAEAIALNSAENFLETIKKIESRNIHGLSTAMCGWSSMLTLLYITEHNSSIVIKPIDYKNSGDSRYGSMDHVVGYWAMAVYENEKLSNTEILFSDEDKNSLISFAMNAIKSKVGVTEILQIEPKNLSKALLAELGVFVSVYVDGALRGCIGRFDGKEPLFKLVEEMAVSAATGDSRFHPVTMDELDQLAIELSVLTPLEKIDSIGKIEPGKHGIYIKKGFNSGTFLPQVAAKNNWSREEFLGHCARDKAHIGWDGWKNAEIYIYEAIVFGSEFS
ncbi:MAG: AmmeMemoRadiSam system protein B [Bacteroidales bacterium]|nr:AmmeMemoRadiSam system protein B [Bacteroidales bacterium]